MYGGLYLEVFHEHSDDDVDKDELSDQHEDDEVDGSNERVDAAVVDAVHRVVAAVAQRVLDTQQMTSHRKPTTTTTSSVS